MNVAIVLIKTVSGMEPSVVTEISKIPEVIEHQNTVGNYNMSIKVKTETSNQLNDVVTRIRSINGILETRTLPTVSFSTIN